MQSGERESARRRWPLALISLTLFLLLLPLTLTKPGTPTVLKADEAAFYLAALSLWSDGDFQCDDTDARRLFREYSGTTNLLLMRSGPGEPVYFSVPVPYPIVATPFVAIFGANGMVLLNAALLMAMVWMGFDYLRRHNDDALSILFTVGFFLFSTSFVYLFWLQAEIFNMACLAAAFYLIERSVDTVGWRKRRRRGVLLLPVQTAGAGALLAVVCYSKPMFALFAIPLLFRLSKERAWRGLASFAASGVVTVLALAGIAYGLTEQVWPYFAPRAGVSLSSPVDYVERRVAPRLAPGDVSTSAPSDQLKQGGRQLRVTMATVIGESAPEFLLGRHGGFLVYMPFAVVAIVLFVANDRRSVFGWLVLTAAALTAAVFLAGVRGQWLGGGGFIGNRYFLTAYPSFFFLVRRVRPAWLTACGYAAAAVFLGPLLITPLGAMVREPTLQAHVRNQPFPRLPLEWSLIDSLSGYRYVPQVGATFHGRADEIVRHEDELWVHGAKAVAISLLTRQPQGELVFEVRNLASENTIEICLQDDCRQLDFEEVPPAGERRRVTFAPQEPERIPRPGRYGPKYRYPLTVKTAWGEQPRWRGSGDERFYLGAALRLSGPTDEAAHDVYKVEWLRVEVPPAVEAGSRFSVPIEIRNASGNPWPSSGTTPVKISYHWLGEAGQTAVWEGKRTGLLTDVAAGQRLETNVKVEAPESAGRYILALDLLREHVSWFSKKDPEQAHRVAVEIVAPQPRTDTTQD